MDCKRNSARIDLHIHSSASDGTLSPLEIVERALSLKLGAIAITDHDTVSGLRQIEAGLPYDNLAFLNGVEISTFAPENCRHKGSLHILGYGFNTADPELNRHLTVLQDVRKNRNPQIIAKLNQLGFPIQLEDIEAPEDGQVGRPHIARHMIRHGYAASMDEAFDLYLGTGKAAYVDKYRIECELAFKLIKGAGGIPVLAHPGLIDLPEDELEAAVDTMVEMGLKGIEAIYPAHDKTQNNLFFRLARKHKLVVTGGTDFHGPANQGFEIGFGMGDFYVPYEIYERLMAVLEAR